MKQSRKARSCSLDYNTLTVKACRIMMEPCASMQSTLFMVLLATVILCHQMEPEEIINSIETIGITTGTIPRLNEVEEWFNGPKREKRQNINHLQNVNLQCKITVENLTTAFRRKIANVPQPAGVSDIATLATAAKIEGVIRNASLQLEEQCAWKDSINTPAEATRTQFLTTEVDDMGAAGVIIYQIGIQRLEFEDPSARPKRP